MITGPNGRNAPLRWSPQGETRRGAPMWNADFGKLYQCFPHTFLRAPDADRTSRGRL